jgi:hypothetical protein
MVFLFVRVHGNAKRPSCGRGSTTWVADGASAHGAAKEIPDAARACFESVAAV